MDSSNPLSDREKAFENKYIHDKDQPLTKTSYRRQMAKDRANKQTQTESSPSTKDSSSTPIEPEEGGGGTYKEEITKLAAMPS
ncbi:hypothetical protein NEUTE1DRAFT_102570 [Neurospora tetrasperma FGSC 2508]|uniref:Uncharacterized protein n=1 Tax=Neurospora tetrasperma (strain FGSC 2508 / ATCC MYA-4615 / P0657) TaxID=510951 RepID=F8MSM8_NEUT8|nr:uncharacterized protein NEUTE1DRAFT_102570 [Neurospora tetrasperma FGSC 2508]EGO55115.1 hypothetical protein NEUTE1DRAFT_102570 [Neurospora tetrasperma FGSC 2508]EGZ69673.1 hypothetical protein NEUTE2DRAFT_132068 [Neurospora tetrasperma FGSC 2509]